MPPNHRHYICVHNRGSKHMMCGKTKRYRGRRGSFIKFSDDCRKILEVLKERGPSTYYELIKCTEIPRYTIDRRLRHLKNIGVIVKVKRKWMLAEHARTYGNEHEYKTYLLHSQQLVKGILAINEFLPQFVPQHDFYAGNIFMGIKKRLKLCSDHEMWTYALQHIRTGYPHIYELFMECAKALELVQKVEMESQRKVLERINKKNTDVPSVKLAENLSEEDKVGSSEAGQAINGQESLKLESKAAELRSMLEDELTKLILRVRNGEPLKGRCKCCPNVYIREKPKNFTEALE